MAIVAVFGWLTVVPVATVLGVAWVLVALINRRLKLRLLIHEEVKLAIEKGADPEVIKELLKGFEAPAKSLLLKGVFVLRWALAVGGFFAFLGSWGLAFLFGVGFGVMGLGMIVYDLIRRKKQWGGFFWRCPSRFRAAGSRAPSKRSRLR